MKKCACKGSFLERFIQPAVLMLLYREPMHGFSLYKRLVDSEFMDYSGVDPSGLYRMLKKMESEGILVSNWDMAQPSLRRVYEITEDGRNCLILWKKTLKEYAETIDRLSKSIEERLGKTCEKT